MRIQDIGAYLTSSGWMEIWSLDLLLLYHTGSPWLAPLRIKEQEKDMNVWLGWTWSHYKHRTTYHGVQKGTDQCAHPPLLLFGPHSPATPPLNSFIGWQLPSQQMIHSETIGANQRYLWFVLPIWMALPLAYTHAQTSKNADPHHVKRSNDLHMSPLHSLRC